MTKDTKFTQEWYNDLLWKNTPQWRKDQLIHEKEQEEIKAKKENQSPE